jgi:hypothetical protein
MGGYTFPDEGSIFLCAVFTLRNIGTSSATVLTAWNTAVYDDVYEYRHHSTDGNFKIDPLMPNETASIIFMVPSIVAESDKSLVINLNDSSGTAVMPFIIRTGATGNGTQTGRTNSTSSQQASDKTSSGTVTDNMNNDYPDEILYNDVPIIIIFELPIDEALAVFGTPVDGTESSLIYENIEVRMYNNKIVSMESFFPDKFAINGTSLETDRIGLIKLLGEPSSEGEGGSGYEMKFERNNYALTIATGDYEGTAWKIWINYYYGDDGSSDDYYNEDDSYPDEIIYNGKPLLNWLGSRLADLREEFGSPEVEGVIGEGGAYGFRYEDIEFVKYEQGEAIESISGMPSSLSINGITLNTNRNQLVSFFGNPVYEDWGDESYYASLGMENSYRISFNYQGKYSISFELDDPNGKAWSFYIYYNNNSFE